MKFIILYYILLLISVINICSYVIGIFEILEIIQISEIVWDFGNGLGFWHQFEIWISALVWDLNFGKLDIMSKLYFGICQIPNIFQHIQILAPKSSDKPFSSIIPFWCKTALTPPPEISVYKMNGFLKSGWATTIHGGVLRLSNAKLIRQ